MVLARRAAGDSSVERAIGSRLRAYYDEIARNRCRTASSICLSSSTEDGKTT